MKLGTRRARVDLTPLEATALLTAARNSMTCDEVALAVLYDRRTVQAASRAAMKLAEAIRQSRK